MHERNLLEKCHAGTGRCPGSLERTLFSAAVLQACGVAVKRKKVKAKVEAEGMRVMSRE